MSATSDINDWEHEPARRSRSVLSWASVAFVGLLVYDLTAQASLGLCVLSMKLIWNNLCTACWLRKHDQHKYRRRSCFWGHLAVGFWKAGGLALVLALALVPFFERGFKAPGNIRSYFIEAGITVLVTLSLGVLCTFLAALFAILGGIKLWVGVEAHIARRFGIWPPWDRKAVSPDHVLFRVLLIESCGVVLLGLDALYFLLACFHPRQAPIWMLLVLVLPCILGGFFVYQVNQKAVALRPSDCWGKEPIQVKIADDSPSELL